MAEDKVKKAGDDLIAEACKAYGIDQKFVFASSVKNGETVILTTGGTRVRFKAGDQVKPLSEIAITGINPEWEKKKVIVGKAKK